MVRAQSGNNPIKSESTRVMEIPVAARKVARTEDMEAFIETRNAVNEKPVSLRKAPRTELESLLLSDDGDDSVFELNSLVVAFKVVVVAAVDVVVVVNLMRDATDLCPCCLSSQLLTGN